MLKMFSAVNKWVIAIFMLVMLASCSNENERMAKQLLEDSNANILCGNYYRAVDLLDSLQETYPTFVEIQREGMHLRPKAIEGITLMETAQNDSLISVLEHEHNLLKDKFSFVNNSELVDGYYVVPEMNRPIFDYTAVQPRLSVDGKFYVISSLNGINIGHTAISLYLGAENATTASVGYDGERNYRSGNTEMITFMPEECDTLGKFAFLHSDSRLSLKFIGKRIHSITLNNNEVRAIATTYRMSCVLSQLKKARLRKEFLEQQLLLARDQIARTYQDSVNVED